MADHQQASVAMTDDQSSDPTRPNGKVYNHSPVATVAFIKTQMRQIRKQREASPLNKQPQMRTIGCQMEASPLNKQRQLGHQQETAQAKIRNGRIMNHKREVENQRDNNSSVNSKSKFGNQRETILANDPGEIKRDNAPTIHLTEIPREHDPMIHLTKIRRETAPNINIRENQRENTSTIHIRENHRENTATVHLRENQSDNNPMSHKREYRKENTHTSHKREMGYQRETYTNNNQRENDIGEEPSMMHNTCRAESAITGEALYKIGNLANDRKENRNQRGENMTMNQREVKQHKEFISSNQQRGTIFQKEASHNLTSDGQVAIGHSSNHTVTGHHLRHVPQSNTGGQKPPSSDSQMKAGSSQCPDITFIQSTSGLSNSNDPKGRKFPESEDMANTFPLSQRLDYRLPQPPPNSRDLRDSNALTFYQTSFKSSQPKTRRCFPVTKSSAGYSATSHELHQSETKKAEDAKRSHTVVGSLCTQRPDFDKRQYLHILSAPSKGNALTSCDVSPTVHGLQSLRVNAKPIEATYRPDWHHQQRSFQNGGTSSQTITAGIQNQGTGARNKEILLSMRQRYPEKNGKRDVTRIAENDSDVNIKTSGDNSIDADVPSQDKQRILNPETMSAVSTISGVSETQRANQSKTTSVATSTPQHKKLVPGSKHSPKTGGHPQFKERDPSRKSNHGSQDLSRTLSCHKQKAASTSSNFDNQDPSSTSASRVNFDPPDEHANHGHESLRRSSHRTQKPFETSYQDTYGSSNRPYQYTQDPYNGSYQHTQELSRRSHPFAQEFSNRPYQHIQETCNRPYQHIQETCNRPCQHTHEFPSRSRPHPTQEPSTRAQLLQHNGASTSRGRSNISMGIRSHLATLSDREHKPTFGMPKHIAQRDAGIRYRYSADSDRDSTPDPTNDNQIKHFRCLEARAKSLAVRRPIAVSNPVASAPNVSKTRQGGKWLRPINLFPEATDHVRSQRESPIAGTRNETGGSSASLKENVVYHTRNGIIDAQSIRFLEKFHSVVSSDCGQSEYETLGYNVSQRSSFVLTDRSPSIPDAHDDGDRNIGVKQHSADVNRLLTGLRQQSMSQGLKTTADMGYHWDNYRQPSTVEAGQLLNNQRQPSTVEAGQLLDNHRRHSTVDDGQRLKTHRHHSTNKNEMRNSMDGGQSWYSHRHLSANANAGHNSMDVQQLPNNSRPRSDPRREPRIRATSADIASIYCGQPNFLDILPKRNRPDVTNHGGCKQNGKLDVKFQIPLLPMQTAKSADSRLVSGKIQMGHHNQRNSKNPRILPRGFGTGLQGHREGQMNPVEPYPPGWYLPRTPMNDLNKGMRDNAASGSEERNSKATQSGEGLQTEYSWSQQTNGLASTFPRRQNNAMNTRQHFGVDFNALQSQHGLGSSHQNCENIVSKERRRFGEETISPKHRRESESDNNEIQDRKIVTRENATTKESQRFGGENTSVKSQQNVAAGNNAPKDGVSIEEENDAPSSRSHLKNDCTSLKTRQSLGGATGREANVTKIARRQTMPIMKPDTSHIAKPQTSGNLGGHSQTSGNQGGHSQTSGNLGGHSQTSGSLGGHSQTSGNLGGHSQTSGSLGGQSQTSGSLGGHSQTSGNLGGHSQTSGSLGGHSQTSGSLGGHSQTSGNQGGHSQTNGSLGGHSQTSGSLGGHSQTSGSLGGHSQTSGNLGGHSQTSGNLGGHSQTSGNLGGHSQTSSSLGGHSQTSGSLGGHSQTSGNQGGHSQTNGSLGGHSQTSGSLGGHSQTSGSLGGHSQTSGNLGGHSQTSGNLGGHSQTSGNLGGHSQTSGSLGGHSQTNGSLGGHSQTSGSLGGHSQTSGNQGGHSQTNGSLGGQSHTSGNLGGQSHTSGILGGHSQTGGSQGGHSQTSGSQGGQSQTSGSQGGHSQTSGSLGGHSQTSGSLGGQSQTSGNLGGQSQTSGNLGGHSQTSGNLGGQSQTSGNLGGQSQTSGSLGGQSQTSGNLGGQSQTSGNLGGQSQTSGNLGGQSETSGNLGGHSQTSGSLGGHSQTTGSQGGQSQTSGNLGGQSQTSGNLGGQSQTSGNLGGQSQTSGNLGGQSQTSGNLGGHSQTSGNQGGHSQTTGSQGGHSQTSGNLGGQSQTSGSLGGHSQTTSSQGGHSQTSGNLGGQSQTSGNLGGQSQTSGNLAHPDSVGLQQSGDNPAQRRNPQLYVKQPETITCQETQLLIRQSGCVDNQDQRVTDGRENGDECKEPHIVFVQPRISEKQDSQFAIIQPKKKTDETSRRVISQPRGSDIQDTQLAFTNGSCPAAIHRTVSENRTNTYATPTIGGSGNLETQETLSSHVDIVDPDDHTGGSNKGDGQGISTSCLQKTRDRRTESSVCHFLHFPDLVPSSKRGNTGTRRSFVGIGHNLVFSDVPDKNLESKTNGRERLLENADNPGDDNIRMPVYSDNSISNVEDGNQRRLPSDVIGKDPMRVHSFDKSDNTTDDVRRVHSDNLNHSDNPANDENPRCVDSDNVDDTVNDNCLDRNPPLNSSRSVPKPIPARVCLTNSISTSAITTNAIPPRADSDDALDRRSDSQNSQGSHQDHDSVSSGYLSLDRRSTYHQVHDDLGAKPRRESITRRSQSLIITSGPKGDYSKTDGRTEKVNLAPPTPNGRVVADKRPGVAQAVDDLDDDGNDSGERPGHGSGAHPGVPQGDEGTVVPGRDDEDGQSQDSPTLLGTPTQTVAQPGKQTTMQQPHTDSSGSSGILPPEKTKSKGHHHNHHNQQQQAMPQVPGNGYQGRRADDPIKSYDSFFQELERDFSQPHPYHDPRGHSGGDDGKTWSDFSSQSPYTSTLEHKHESTTSSSERGNKASRKPHARTSLSPHSNCSSLRSDSQYSSCYSGTIRRQDSFNTRPGKYPDNYPTDVKRNVNLYRVNENVGTGSNTSPGPGGIPGGYELFQSRNSGSFDNNGTISSHTSSNEGRKGNNSSGSNSNNKIEHHYPNAKSKKSHVTNSSDNNHNHHHHQNTNHLSHHHRHNNNNDNDNDVNNHHNHNQHYYHHHHRPQHHQNASNSSNPQQPSPYQNTPVKNQPVTPDDVIYGRVDHRAKKAHHHPHLSHKSSPGNTANSSNLRGDADRNLNPPPPSILNGRTSGSESEGVPMPLPLLGASGDGDRVEVDPTSSALHPHNNHDQQAALSHRWPEACSYSDNEKQLLEEMRRMKKEHQNVLRTYEGRVNKLMAKMHELRNIAEMLEHSSNKSSPFGALPAKIALLKILGEGQSERLSKQVQGQVPPPLPPRPGRGSRVYPNKPIVSPGVDMKGLPWDRLILDGSSQASMVWQGCVEPELDREDLERNFSGVDEVTPNLTLYDDVCQNRGLVKTETVGMYDTDRSQRIASELRNLNCTLRDVTTAFVTLNPGDLYMDSFAELLELLASHRELDKIYTHVKRKGPDLLDAPEYLVYELSKVDNFRERLEFLRFKNKLQINLFEIDQQLRELHIACNEITSSLALKHVLETILAVGNFMNGGTDKGQADGFKLEVINSLKYIQDKTRKGNLLEFVMKVYCQRFESDLTHGCPTHFRLPEPSNMRHAAQVSFEDIQRALKELKDELSFVMNKLENLSRKQGNLNQALKVTSENFLTSAVEVLAEEQKLLDDTKLEFRKTVAFFTESEECSTPHAFFQLWASFLHDCKYYWKLAHRNLARAKFTEELATKSQLSCSSLPGFNNLKSVMMKHVASFQHQDEMDASKAQQLQHISSWIESVGRYTMEPEANQTVALQNHSHRYQNTQSLVSQRKPDPMPQYVNSAMYLEGNFGGDVDMNRERDQNTNHKLYDRDEFFPSSPKPIKATPPNVIKPLPISHISPTVSSPSPSSPHLRINVKPVSLVQAQPSSPSVATLTADDDTFGFAESNPAPWSSPESQATSQQNQVQSPISPNGENQKRNPFFKNLLKKDQKKSSPQANHEDGSHQTSKGVAAPLNKLKNTFVQKLSGGGNLRKSKDSKSSRHRDNGALSPPTNLQVYIPDPSDMGFNAEASDYPIGSNRDGVMTSGSRSREGKPLSPDYQNFHPSQPRRPEPTESAVSFQPLVARDDVESLPSTMSSIRNGREVSSYTSRAYVNGDANAFPQDDNNHEEIMSNPSEINSVSSSMKPSFPRLRSAIALGSNISISDVFDRISDSTLIDDHAENSPDCADMKQAYDGNGNNKTNNNNNLDRKNDNNNNSYKRSVVAAVPTVSDQKIVRTNAVPVYKAKLIPNYENQTKMDPRMEAGIRGQAEPVHVPQLSVASESYKQELQKKSEQYVAGGAYHSYGPGQNRGFLGNKIPGAPTSYTVMPPKPSRYHASPIHVSPFGGYPFTSPNTNGESDKSQKDKKEVRGDQNSLMSSHSKSAAEMSTPNFRSEKIPREEKGAISFGGSNTVPIPGRRSASAHDLLEREGRSDKPKVPRKPENFTTDSTDFKGSQGHISRRDLGDKKNTATSRRGQSHGRQKGSPVAINSLINKFEKRPHSEQPTSSSAGLLDINDKPPSMTSTPVSRRKISNTPPSSSHSHTAHGNSLTPASDGENYNSQSRRGEGIGHRSGSGPSSVKNLSKHFAKFESLQPSVNAQGHSSPSNGRETSQHSEHGVHQQRDGSSGKRKAEGHGGQQRHKVNSRSQSHAKQEASSDNVTPKRRSTEHVRSDFHHSSSGKRTGHSSATDFTSHRNRHSTPSSTCSSQQSSTYLSPYIPKPEAQYPSSVKRNQQSPSSSASYSSSPSKSSSYNVGKKYPSEAQFQSSNHWQQLQPQGQASQFLEPQGFSSQFLEPQSHTSQFLEPQGFSSQFSDPAEIHPAGPQSRQSSHNYNSWPTSSSSTEMNCAGPSNEEGKRDDNSSTHQQRQVWNSFHKSNGSAFNQPSHGTFPHSGHKSALAIVKPTVMHL